MFEFEIEYTSDVNTMQRDTTTVFVSGRNGEAVGLPSAASTVSSLFDRLSTVIRDTT